MSSMLIESPKVRARAVEISGAPAPEAVPPPPAAPTPAFRARAAAAPGPAPERPIVSARATMGQAAATVPQAPVQAAIQTAPMSLEEATAMLPGLKSAVDTADAGMKSGAKCVDLLAADLELARTYLSQMSQFVAAKVAGSTLTVQKNWLDAADKVVRCAILVDKASPNTGAYIALGVIVVGGIVALNL